MEFTRSIQYTNAIFKTISCVTQWALVMFANAMVAQNIGIASYNIGVYYYASHEKMELLAKCCEQYIKTDYCNDQLYPYAYVTLDKITIPVVKKIASKQTLNLIQEIFAEGSALNERIRTTFNLSIGRVKRLEIVLFDDIDEFNVSSPCYPHFNVSGAPEILWPSSRTIRLAQSPNFSGMAIFSESAAERIVKYESDLAEWYEAIIHHVAHAQYANELGAEGSYLWENESRPCDNFVTQNVQSRHELIDYEPGAVREGLANYVSMTMNPSRKEKLRTFLNDDNFKFLVGSHTNLSKVSDIVDKPFRIEFKGILPKDHIVLLNSKESYYLPFQDIQLEEFEVRRYRWQDIPAFYIFNSPQMVHAYLWLYEEFGFDNPTNGRGFIEFYLEFLTSPKEAVRYVPAIANVLALSIEEKVNEEGTNENPSGIRTSSMFAYALFDILTHYGFSEEDLKAEFVLHMEPRIPVQKPKAFEHYWAHRENVKELVCPFLGAGVCSGGDGKMDILAAVEAAKVYFSDPLRMLK